MTFEEFSNLVLFEHDYDRSGFNTVVFSCRVIVKTAREIDRMVYKTDPCGVEEFLRDEMTHKLWDHMQLELGGYTDAQLMHAYHLGMHSAYDGEVLTKGELVDKIRGEKGL